MTWESGNLEDKHSAKDRIRWAQKNYAKYSLEEKVHRRMALLINLVTLDALIAQEGGEELLSPETVTTWLELYLLYRPTLSVGRPARNSL